MEGVVQVWLRLRSPFVDLTSSHKKEERQHHTKGRGKGKHHHSRMKTGGKAAPPTRGLQRHSKEGWESSTVKKEDGGRNAAEKEEVGATSLCFY